MKHLVEPIRNKVDVVAVETYLANVNKRNRLRNNIYSGINER